MKTIRSAVIWSLRIGLFLALLAMMPGASTAKAQDPTLGEAVDNTDLVWSTGGDADWFGQTSVYYYDDDAAQSGYVADGESSWIQTTVTDPGILSFYWKVSSIWVSGDLEFYIDGVRKASCRTYEGGWELKSYTIPTGNHVLKWDYAPFFDHEEDAGFLDQVVFNTDPVITVNTPNGGETWHHRTYNAIRWLSHEGTDTQVKIELYKGGSLNYTISTSTENDGYYSWLVPLELDAGTDYQIKVTAVSNPSIYDQSDNDFSISEWYQSSFGGFLVLDGDDDYAETSDHSELDVGDETGEGFTLEAWVYIRDAGQVFSRQDIINKTDSYVLYANGYYDYSSMRTFGCISYRLTLTSGQVVHVQSCRWPSYSARWHHVALVYYQELKAVQIYLDGEEFGSAYDIGSAINNSTEGVKVGENFYGIIDEIRISDTPRYLTTTAVPTLPFTCDANTRALWHFDEYEGATVFHDSCGTDNILVGYYGAHTEGIPARKIYLPCILK